MENEKFKQSDLNIAATLYKHKQMLNDELRNKLIFEAMKRHISSETTFLDIGSGTGVWAILAAKLGAARVVAVEIEESLIPIIHRHAQENGVEDKIEIIRAAVEDVKIEGKFNLIVSEVFGDDVFRAETIRAFVDLRTRFLADDGILIPHKLALCAAPVKIEDSVQNVPAGLPLKCDFFKSIKLNFSQNLSLAERSRIKFLAEPRRLAEIDFRSVTRETVVEKTSAVWDLENLSEANAFVTFTQSHFADDLVMNNFESRSWSGGLYEFVPYSKTSGEIRFSLETDLRKRNWSVDLPSLDDARKQSFSPVFAAGHIKMMSGQIYGLKEN